MIQPSKNASVIVRFPPSPTGPLHIGGARTALFNYLFAKKNDGKIFLRLEDTDRERSKPEYEKNILDSLNWLGLSFDNHQPIKQSERVELYREYLKRLVDSGKAYVSQEGQIENIKKSDQRTEVIRFRNPNKNIHFNDLIRGEISFDTSELGDFVIAKSFDEPLYHLTVVVDDYEMGVTHIIRGEDHISNTPRQILLQDGIGASRPIYAHIPLILASDRSKLSKRHGAVSVTEYRDRGFIKEAVINYLALLGWNPGTDQEIFSIEELIKKFSIEKINKSGAIFDEEKLKWFNRQYLKFLPERIKLSETVDRLSDIPKEILKRSYQNILERVDIWDDLKKLDRAGELDFYKKAPILEKTKIPWQKISAEVTNRHLTKAIELINSLSENPSKDDLQKTLLTYADAEGRGAVLWPIRYALTGKDRSPDPFTVSANLGKTETISRLSRAIAVLT